MKRAADDNWKELRRYPRSRVLWHGTLRHAGEKLDCIVLDVSANGAHVRAEGLPAKLGALSLALPRFGDFVAELRWRDGSELGLRFAASPRKVAALLGDTLPAVNLEDDAAD
jgi:hypothetical protein